MVDERPLVAAVDQGSSSTKAAIVAADGRRLDETNIEVATTSDGTSVQHDAEELAASVETALDQLLGRGEVAAIGITCQRSTCLLWERTTGRALTPAISWQDTSEAARIARLAPHSRTVHSTTGLRLSPHYAAAKLAALLDRHPDARKGIEGGEVLAGTLDAFLLQRLSGRAATEPGHAGRTLLFDVSSARWSEELCDLFGVPISALPNLETSAGDHGRYRGVPITAVAGDQQAALLGHGGWQAGVTAVHFGTGAFVLSGTGEKLLQHPAALSAVVASTPESIAYQVEATVNSAGSALDWAARLTGIPLADWDRVVLDPERLPLVLPAFRGLGSPWWRPDASPVIAGLTLETSARELFAGTMAGVAMRVLDCVELLSSIAPASSLRASGKLTRLPGLVGILADAGQIPVELAGEEEVGLVGIARLARAGLEGSTAMLRPEPTDDERREPAWSCERARAVRERWREFVESALPAEPVD